MNSYLSTIVASERHVALVRSAERDRILREADVPTSVESIRLIVGRSVVRIGNLIAGRRLWIPTQAAEPLAGAPATTSALTPAR